MLDLCLFRCDWTVNGDGGVSPLSTEDRETTVRNVIQPMASDGLRTMCIAYKDYIIAAPSQLLTYMFHSDVTVAEIGFINLCNF